jgi:hypothetical protein
VLEVQVLSIYGLVLQVVLFVKEFRWTVVVLLHTGKVASVPFMMDCWFYLAKLKDTSEHLLGTGVSASAMDRRNGKKTLFYYHSLLQVELLNFKAAVP